MEYSYQRYLKSKATIDARAMHPRVWSNFINHVVRNNGSEIHIVEVGCGLGDMLQKIVSILESKTIFYTGIDSNIANIEYAQSTYSRRPMSESIDHWTAIEHPDSGSSCNARFIHSDVFNIDSDMLERPADAVIAKAVIDLVPIRRFLQTISTWTIRNTLLYCPITFNGQTAFYPFVEDADLDARVWTVYHDSMDLRNTIHDGRRGGSRAGDRFIHELIDMPGAMLVDAGGSDWYVAANASGCYPDNEQYFLQHILHLVDKELESSGQISRQDRTEWVTARRRQIEAATCAMRAHNLDILARL